MSDLTDNLSAGSADGRPTADEIVAGVQRLSDQRAEYMERLHDVELALLVMKRERDELRQELEEIQRNVLLVHPMDVPFGRDWTFFEDALVLAVSPGIDDATRRRLLAQVEQPELMRCETCGAPVWSGAVCGMH